MGMSIGEPANGSGAPHPPADRPGRRRRPPAELILVVVITYVAGFVAIGVGILFILLRYVADNGLLGGESTVTLIGAIVILLGFFILAMASALARGKHYARVLTTIAMAVEFLLAVVALVIDPSAFWFELALMAVTVLITLVLWFGRTGRYFTQISELDAAARQGPR